MPEKFKVGYGTSNAYKRYIKKVVKQRGESFHISAKKHEQILNLYHKLILDKIIYKNFVYKMPVFNLRIRVRKFKQKLKYDDNGKIVKSELPVNWKETKELWIKDSKAREKKTLIYHLNDHTDGYRYRLTYRYHNPPFKAFYRYSFRASRILNRTLSSYLQDPFRTSDYYE